MGNFSLSQDTYKNAPAVRLTTGSNLDMQATEALAALLCKAVAGGQPVIVDASLVERMSTGAVQLFLAADKAMTQTDSALTLDRPSAPFMAAFDDCGFNAADMGWTVLEGESDD